MPRKSAESGSAYCRYSRMPEKTGYVIAILEPVQSLDQGKQCKAKLNEKAEHTRSM
jgi:hypothetical protein